MVFIEYWKTFLTIPDCTIESVFKFHSFYIQQRWNDSKKKFIAIQTENTSIEDKISHMVGIDRFRPSQIGAAINNEVLDTSSGFEIELFKNNKNSNYSHIALDFDCLKKKDQPEKLKKRAHDLLKQLKSKWPERAIYWESSFNGGLHCILCVRGNLFFQVESRIPLGESGIIFELKNQLLVSPSSGYATLQAPDIPAWTKPFENIQELSLYIEDIIRCILNNPEQNCLDNITKCLLSQLTDTKSNGPNDDDEMGEESLARQLTNSGLTTKALDTLNTARATRNKNTRNVNEAADRLSSLYQITSKNNKNKKNNRNNKKKSQEITVNTSLPAATTSMDNDADVGDNDENDDDDDDDSPPAKIFKADSMSNKNGKITTHNNDDNGNDNDDVEDVMDDEDNNESTINDPNNSYLLLMEKVWKNQNKKIKNNKHADNNNNDDYDEEETSINNDDRDEDNENNINKKENEVFNEILKMLPNDKQIFETVVSQAPKTARAQMASGFVKETNTFVAILLRQTLQAAPDMTIPTDFFQKYEQDVYTALQIAEKCSALKYAYFVLGQLYKNLLTHFGTIKEPIFPIEACLKTAQTAVSIFFLYFLYFYSCFDIFFKKGHKIYPIHKPGIE